MTASVVAIVGATFVVHKNNPSCMTGLSLHVETVKPIAPAVVSDDDAVSDDDDDDYYAPSDPPMFLPTPSLPPNPLDLCRST